MISIPSWLRVSIRNSKPAFQEFGYLVVFSLMPVWLGALVVGILLNQGFLSYLGNFLSSGEALLICATTVGPLMYAISKDYQKRDDGFSRTFPFKTFLSLSIVIICVASASLIGIRSVPLNSISISRDALWYLSLTTTVLSIIIWFTVMILKNSLESAPQIMREDENSFLRKWNS